MIAASPWDDDYSASRYPSLDEALTALCLRAEQLASGSVAGLTICNPARTHIERALFPKLPEFAGAIRDVPTHPVNFGSCVKAVTSGDVITVSDIERDTRFDPRWQQLCLSHGLRSLQSRPVLLRDGKPYATFVLAFQEPREETAWNVTLMTFAADAAGLALQEDLDRRNIAAE
jgi:GAF domain-containing protein